MTIFTKISIVFFPIIVYAVLWLIFRFLKLHHSKRIRVSDILVIFLVFGLESFIKTAAGTTFLPYYLMLASGIGLALLLIDLFIYKDFRFSKFFRRFWRVISIVTSVMYFCLILVALFLK